MCAPMHIFLIALMVQSGLAIKCFNCDSGSNERCANMTDPNIIQEECDDAKQRELESHYDNHNRHWLLKISDVHFHRPPKSKSDAVDMMCQKLVGIDDQKRITVVRRCQLANVFCNYSMEKLTSQFPNSLKIESCEICGDKDGCNGASNTHVFGIVIGIVVAATLSRHL